MARKSLLNDKPEILVRKFYDLLRRKKIPIEKMILFGSQVKGKAKPWSDIDICVVSEDFGKDSFSETVMLKQIASDIEPLIEPHPYHPKDLLDRWDPLAREITKYGKTLVFR